jgi:hypothetical protein
MNRKNSGRRPTGLTVIAAMLVTAPTPALASNTPQPFSAPSDAATFDRALQCLTQAIYYEARSEPDEGQRAVAQVVLNRVRHPSYPDSVCGVVYQGSTRSTGCQFTFTCDGSMGRGIEPSAWARAERIAEAALRGSVYRPVGLALNYHTTAIRPYWAPSLVRQAVVGSHIFYRRPDSGDVRAFSQMPSGAEVPPGFASASPATRTQRPQVGRVQANYQVARLEVATVQRPRVERPTIERHRVERPVVQGSARATATRRASLQSQPPAAQSQPRAAPAPRGPRTTIEGGVRVMRGS